MNRSRPWPWLESEGVNPSCLCEHLGKADQPSPEIEQETLTGKVSISKNAWPQKLNFFSCKWHGSYFFLLECCQIKDLEMSHTHTHKAILKALFVKVLWVIYSEKKKKKINDPHSSKWTCLDLLNLSILLSLPGTSKYLKAFFVRWRGCLAILFQ